MGGPSGNCRGPGSVLTARRVTTHPSPSPASDHEGCFLCSAKCPGAAPRPRGAALVRYVFRRQVSRNAESRRHTTQVSDSQALCPSGGSQGEEGVLSWSPPPAGQQEPPGRVHATGTRRLHEDSLVRQPQHPPLLGAPLTAVHFLSLQQALSRTNYKSSLSLGPRGDRPGTMS